MVLRHQPLANLCLFAAALLTRTWASGQTVCEQSVCDAKVDAGLVRESALLQTRILSERVSKMQFASSGQCVTCFDAFKTAGGCEALQLGDLNSMLAVGERAGCGQDNDCTKSAIEARCAADQLSAAVPCTDSCMSAFAAADVCSALETNDFEGIATMMTSPALAECTMTSCEARIFERCFPEEWECDNCVEMFASAGGCDAAADKIAALIPAGCAPCGKEVATYCQNRSRVVEQDCAACIVALGPPGECASMFQGEGSSPLPPQCAGRGRSCMEESAVHCLHQTPRGCRTASQGDVCFQHIRWAMQTGVVVHPEWYPGLSQWSSFEAFQSLLHDRGYHACQAPCPPLPEIGCHTAVLGDLCYGHVTWAMESGAALRLSKYPAALTSGNSSFEDYQGWLHHIHHGDCPAPCRGL